MCGIAGLISREGLERSELEKAAVAMAGRLQHRGPDDQAAWADPDPGIALAFQRLAILDLSLAGRQPMTSSTGRFLVVFNGEIYNFLELKKVLVSKGRSLKGRSDTEVLLEAVEEWGVEGAVPRFRGMFAFGLWDREEKRLWLARDRMGIKPLFLYRDAKRIAFFSELRSVFSLPSAQLTLNKEILPTYLRRLYVPAPESVFREVAKVPPGTLLSIHAPTLEETDEAFWSLTDVALSGSQEPDLSEAEGQEAIHEELREAVRIRLRSDVALGAFLSGGIDSSTVVAVAQSQSTTPLRTFSVAFDSDRFNEGPFAAAVAQHLGTDHKEVKLSEKDLLNLVPGMSSFTDEPLADPSQLPTHLISKVARESVTVCLTGDGGDELFGGYNRYSLGGRYLSRLGPVPGPVRRLLALGLQSVPSRFWDGAIADAVDGSDAGRLQHSRASRIEKLSKLLKAGSKAEMYRALTEVGLPDSSVLNGTPRAKAEDLSVLEDGRLEMLERMMLWDQLAYLPDDLLAKVDRCSMAVSLEARVPILDHEIVELAWRLPQGLRVNGGTGKIVLRRILQEYLPSSLVERPKMGFSVPLTDWLRGPLKPWAEGLLQTDSLASVGVFEPAETSHRWEEFQKGETDDALGLWAVLVLQDWCRTWGVRSEPDP